MTIQPLRREEVIITVAAEPELVPVEGNASCSGNEDFDREVEHNVLSRLQQGDVWAWASVLVIVSWNGFEGRSSLGCCSYADENDFRQSFGYFEDMVAEALAELNKRVLDAYERIKVRENAA